jgi:putative transposase
MPNYRRVYQPGGTFFFTLVTHNRQQIFQDSQAHSLLRQSIRQVQADMPFDVLAMVLMPDHLHCIWRLPEDDADFSVRWSCIKKGFTRSWLRAGGRECAVPAYREKFREKGIWQRRFWEHTIRNEDDFIKHVNYIHYNPVKHKLVACPHLWPHSSFHRWVRQGYYKVDWLCDCGTKNIQPPDFRDIQSSVGE